MHFKRSIVTKTSHPPPPRYPTVGEGGEKIGYPEKQGEIII